MNKEVYNSITSRLPLKKRTELDVKAAKFTYPKSSKRDDIIDWIIKTQFVDYYTIQLIGNDDPSVDDVIQDIYVEILEKSQEDWDKITSQGFAVIRAYLSGMIYRQVKSSHSQSYYKYRRYNQHRTSIEEIPATMANIEKTLSDYEEE